MFVHVYTCQFLRTWVHFSAYFTLQMLLEAFRISLKSSPGPARPHVIWCLPGCPRLSAPWPLLLTPFFLCAILLSCFCSQILCTCCSPFFWSPFPQILTWLKPHLSGCRPRTEISFSHWTLSSAHSKTASLGDTHSMITSFIATWYHLILSYLLFS